MNIIKKTLLIFIGIILSLGILEMALQTASILIKATKTYNISKKLNKEGTLTILCLGESTTYMQWPKFLKEEIKKQGVKKNIEVIDDGIAGTNTNIIISKIQSNIEQFHPDIIITMMGINDLNHTVANINSYQLKVQKLLYLIKEHLVENIYAKDIIIPKDNFDIMLKKAQKFFENKEYDKAISICELLKEKNGNDTMKKYHMLIDSYYERNSLGDHQKMEAYLKKIDRDSVPILYLHILISQNRQEEIRSFFSSKIKQNFVEFVYQWFDPIMCEIPRLEKLGMNDLVIKINQIILKSNNFENTYATSRVLGYMAIDNIKKYNFKQAEKLWQMQTNFLLRNANKQTIDNYRTIAQICQDNGIKLIAMQYPVRNIKPLEKILEGFNEVAFISNEENFKKALTNHKVKEIFNDQFGGDFGHCTNYGNILIAKNVAKTIQKIIQ